MPATFGIDFGTTNTRVAYFDAERVRVVKLANKGDAPGMLPTRIAYQGGKAVAFGDAAADSPDARLFPQPLKWMLNDEGPVEVGGGTRDRVGVVADFVKHLKTLVAQQIIGRSMDSAAVTIPVAYPAAARARLAQAFRDGGVEVSHFFYEPTAAIYAGLCGDPVEGVSAVFDWGGGSLDVAAVEVRDGIALTRHVGGRQRGGSDFDRAIANLAFEDFKAKHPDHRGLAGATLTQAVGNTSGRDLIRNAEAAKKKLNNQLEAEFKINKFFGSPHLLEYKIGRETFHDLTDGDIRGGLALLQQSLAEAGQTTPKTVSRLLFSGGTCQMKRVRDQVAAAYGEKLRERLRLPAGLTDPQAVFGLDDVGYATAIGAALLAAFGTAPVFAASIGVRLAGGDADRFAPVFTKGDAVEFGKPTDCDYFVADASGGVARLLICEQTDPHTQPGGRLSRMIAVPLHRDEKKLHVKFTVDRHLTLRVEATGERDIRDANGVKHWPHPPSELHALNLGFRLPPVP